MTTTLPTLAETGELRSARDLGKSKNRRQLLDAASKAIHKYGVRGATIAVIQQESGLSRGMINLHFGTKENLLLDVAKDLAEKYNSCWATVSKNRNLSAQDRLKGIIQIELSPDVLNERDVAIWFAFRSEVVSRPEYRAYIDSRDTLFCNMITDLCRELAQDMQADRGDAALAANALIALFEGMWTDFHLHSARFDRKLAERTCFYVAQRFFPTAFV